MHRPPPDAHWEQLLYIVISPMRLASYTAKNILKFGHAHCRGLVRASLISHRPRRMKCPQMQSVRRQFSIGCNLPVSAFQGLSCEVCVQNSNWTAQSVHAAGLCERTSKWRKLDRSLKIKSLKWGHNAGLCGRTSKWRKLDRYFSSLKINTLKETTIRQWRFSPSWRPI